MDAPALPLSAAGSRPSGGLALRPDPALVRDGYARARGVTRAHAKSFFFASHLLFGARRRAAFALYAFCRRLDDLVDEGPAEGLTERLRAARALIASLYGGGAASDADWLHPAERAALADTITRFGIPEAPFQDLVSGMEMDLAAHRYETWEDLDLYCYRVAGVVGLMLFPVLGGRDPQAHDAAVALGRAMQLTNILRDVREDLERGRVYLPAAELQAFGLSRADLEAGRVDARWRDFMRFQIARARASYARALDGVRFLRAFGAQATVRVMAAVYGGILGAIEARGLDVFQGRAVVPFRRKVLLAARALLPGAP